MEPLIESTTHISRPLGVSRAVWLISASFAIGGIRAVVDLAHKFSGTPFLLALGGLIVFLGICFFFVSKIAAGRNWARILFLVLVLLGLPFAILGYVVELRTSLPRGVVSVLVGILQVIGTYLLFTKSSGPWFKSHK